MCQHQKKEWQTEGHIKQLEALNAALRDVCKALVHPNSSAGIAISAQGQYCVYCNWTHTDYDAKPEHDRRCPITVARSLITSHNRFDTCPDSPTEEMPF